MSVNVSRYSADEAVDMAQNIYDQQLRRQMEAENLGRYIAIDVESGEYEVGDNYHTAARHLRERNPNGEFAVLRIGYAAIGRIGGYVTKVARP